MKWSCVCYSRPFGKTGRSAPVKSGAKKKTVLFSIRTNYLSTWLSVATVGSFAVHCTTTPGRTAAAAILKA